MQNLLQHHLPVKDRRPFITDGKQKASWSVIAIQQRFSITKNRSGIWEGMGLNPSLRTGSRWSISAPGVGASGKSSGKAARRERDLVPLHQTSSHRIALLFATRARDSKVSLLAGYLNPFKDSLFFFPRS